MELRKALILTAWGWTIFSLSGCLGLSPMQESRKERVSTSPAVPAPPQTDQQKFRLQGGVFSISTEGLLYFVDLMNRSIVHRVNLQNMGEEEEFINLEDWLKQRDGERFQIDDLWLDHEGRLLLAESSTGKILRISQDARKLENLADSYDGYRFSQIKGLVGSKTGEIFVGSPHAATLYRIDTVKGKINVLNEDLVRSSDLAVDSSGSRLLVAESDPNRIVVYDLDHNDSIHLGWTLIDFPNQEDRPQSLTFLRTPKDHLMVLLGDGSKLQVYHLARGRVVHTQNLPFLARRVRIHENWIYLQAEDYIVRKKIPQSLLQGRARKKP